jgi:2-haloacid dehalogenase
MRHSSKGLVLDFAKFRALSFDCYGTLVAWEDGIFSALRPILAAHRKTLTDLELLGLYGELEAAAERPPFRPYREVLTSVVRGFGERLGFTPTEAEVRSLPDSVKDWMPFPDTVKALRQLSGRYQLAIISNVDDDLFAFTQARLGVRFDQVITAQQAGCYKPGKKIFELAESRIGVGRQQWLHIGQSIYHDVLPAQSLGVATVWVNRPSPRRGVGAVVAAQGKPDLEVPDLRTLAQAAA